MLMSCMIPLQGQASPLHAYGTFNQHRDDDDIFDDIFKIDKELGALHDHHHWKFDDDDARFNARGKVYPGGMVLCLIAEFSGCITKSRRKSKGKGC